MDGDELDIYLNGDNDQPTECPLCAARTDWVEVAFDRQQHTCLGCGYVFLLELEEEDES